MTVRPAHTEEVSRIAELVRDQAERGQLLPRSCSSVLASLQDWFVFEQDDLVLGCVCLAHHREDLAEVRSLAIAEEARGRGCAKTLLRVVREEAGWRGAASVFAQTRAVRLFEKVGFRVMEAVPLCGRHLRDGYHRVVADLTRPLSPGLESAIPQPLQWEADELGGPCEDEMFPGALMLPESTAPPDFHLHHRAPSLDPWPVSPHDFRGRRSR